MPTFNVPVLIEINGSIMVECDSAEEAIEAAKAEYDRRRAKFKKNESIGGLAAKLIDAPDVEVDFAHGEDPSEVESMDDMDDEEGEDPS